MLLKIILMQLYLFEININDYLNIRKRLFKLNEKLFKYSKNIKSFKQEIIVPFDFKNANTKNDISVKLYTDELFSLIFAYIKINNSFYKVLVDTGSFDLFFFSTNSNLNEINMLPCGNKFCKITEDFQRLSYGSGFVEGNISIFNYSNINYKFLLVDQTNIPNLNFDSLWGVGPSKTYRMNSKSFPEIFNKRFIIFNFLKKDKKMIFSNNCEFSNYNKNILKSNSKHFFSTYVSFKIENKKESFKSEFIFDTGTSLIILPILLKNYFSFSNIKNCYNDSLYDLYICDKIDKLPTIKLNIGNSIYILNPIDYTIFIDDVYVIAIQFDSTNLGILGLSFLKKYKFCHDLINNNTIFVNNKKNFFTNNFLLIIIFLFIIIIILLIIFYLNKKKNEKTYIPFVN